jgi:hypothetical protein
VLRNQELTFKRGTGLYDIHLTPLNRDGGKPSLLLMFAPQEAAAGTTRRSAPKKARSVKKKTAKKSRSVKK